MKILEVLTFLIKSLGTSVCNSVLYLATLILFSAEVSASRCLFFCLSGSVHPEVGMEGGVGVGGAGRGNIRVGLDLPEQTDLSAYLDILSLKLLCGQLSLD